MAQPVVNVAQGWLRGRRVSSIIEESFISFKGIPYAAPPTGALRFKDPQPAEPWTGFRDAFEEGPVCAQKSWMTPNFRGDDDCLYLNIATKSLKGSQPVMVWVHGGGFAAGSSSSDAYGPDYLLKADIVFVSFNYRLNVLGFLNLDDEVAPGNAGLKDQVAALRWVKQNISQFGGDPNNVTIFGESAGGESVNYLLLSPLTKGLFRRAITQSGAAMNSWIHPSKSVELARELVTLLGKDTEDPVEIVDHLRTVPVLELVEAAEKLRASKDKLNGASLFLPSIDAKSPQPFLPRSVYELTADGFDVPAIVGYNSHEGLLFGRALTDEFYSEIDEDFSIILPRNFKDLVPEKISELRELYFGDKPINGEVVDELVQCLGHLHFVHGVHRVINGQLHKKTPTYLYKFSYESPNALSKSVFKTDINGCSHGEDLRYIFYAKAFDTSGTLSSDPVDQTLSDRFIKMWTDFAATGNPTPQVDDDLITAKWEAITSTKKNYLAIDDTLNIDSNPDEEIIEKLIQILDFHTETDCVERDRRAALISTVNKTRKDTKDPEEIAANLRAIPLKDLVNAVESLRVSNVRITVAWLFRADIDTCSASSLQNNDKWRSLFLPGVDDKSPNPFLPRSVGELAAEGFDVPVIIGHTSHEGLLFTSAFSQEFYSQINVNFALTLPGNLKEISATRIAEMRNLYFDGKQINAEMIDDLIQYYGDLYFVLLTHRVIDAQATKRTPTYIYKFCHENPNSFGPAHGDEIKYLFHSPQFGPMLSIEPGTSEQTISDRLIKMWTDFAKTGNPTPQWDDLVTVRREPTTPTAKKYVSCNR